MHKQTIKDALFWTVILFNTVLEVPADMSMPAQIFGAAQGINAGRVRKTL